MDHFLEIARFVESQGGEPTDELLAEIEKAELAIDCFHELGGEPKYLKSCILKKKDKGLRVRFEEAEQPKKKQEKINAKKEGKLCFALLKIDNQTLKILT